MAYERFVSNFKTDEMFDKYIRSARGANSYYGEELMVIRDMAYKPSTSSTGEVEPGYSGLFYVGPKSCEDEVLQRFWDIFNNRK